MSNLKSLEIRIEIDEEGKILSTKSQVRESIPGKETSPTRRGAGQIEGILKKRNPGRRFMLVFGALLFLSFGFIKDGSAQYIIPSSRISSAITIDGNVTDEEWSTIEPLILSQKVPNAGDPPSQKTEVRMAYDDEYLYLSGRMFDDEPDKIVANSKKRDDFAENTEWFGFLIDSYNDRENALAFYVTPTGSKLDMALANDIQGPGAFNLSWNSFWDSASIRDERGWFAEIRVPFSSLPFEAINGEVIMGVTIWRYFARNDETDIYPARDLSSGSSFRPSLTQRFSFQSISEKKPVYITPYLLAGVAQENLDVQEGSDNDLSLKKEIGLDAKISLGSNTTLDLSLNTDFAQVEADEQQINLTRLNIFFPEKRLFFQERAGLFDFNFGNNDKLFHSRRIGIVDGQQARIFGGMRLIGKSGDWEGGVLSMQSDSQSDLNSENFSVIRVKRRVLNENSNIGLIATHRGDFQGDYNFVYGVDGNIRYLNENFLALRFAQSVSEDVGAQRDILDGSKFYLELSNRAQKGPTYNLNLGRSGKEYTPGIGFEHRFDFTKLASMFTYNIFPRKESRIAQHGPYLNSDITWGNENKVRESQFVNLGYNVLTKSGFTFDLSGFRSREYLQSDLQLTNDLSVDPGDYSFNFVTGLISSPSSNRLNYAGSLSLGNFYSGSKTSLMFAPVVNINPDLAVSGRLEINRLDFNNSTETLALSSLKMLYTFSTKLSINTLVQHNSLSDSFFGSFRIRYSPRDGDDFYFVYNGDSVQEDRRTFLPSRLSSTALLKYSRTFHK